MIPAYLNGQLEPVEKLKVHQLGLKHIAISVFLIADGKILMQQRAMSKYHTPGLWANTCCTHPHWGEDTEKTAIRRLEEELGIADVAIKKRETVEYRADVPPKLIEHEVADIFVGHCSEKIAVKPNPSEVMSYRWISLAELEEQLHKAPDKFTPWFNIYMAEHADRIFSDADFKT